MDFGNLKLGIKKKPEDAASPLRELELSLIERDPNQPRREIDPAKLEELAQDIKQHGLLQPIIVRPNPDKEGHFIIIAGERRFRACQELSQTTIQALVRDDAQPADLGYWQMAENMKREDLKFYEIADFIAAKVQAGEKKGTIATQLGMRADQVSRYLIWQDAPQWLRDLKDRFESIRNFYDFTKEAEQHPDDLQSFIGALPEDELLNNGTLKAFRASLEPSTLAPLASEANEPSKDEAPSLLADAEAEASAHDADLVDSATTAEDRADEDGEVLQYDKTHDSESAPAEADEASSEDLEPEFGLADDQAAEAGDDLDFFEAQDAEPETEAETEAAPEAETEAATTDSTELALDDGLDLAPAEDGSADLLQSDDDTDQQLKHPLILGHVESREAELQYQRRPASDGFVWVKFENGTVESVLAESFVLNRIVEG